MKAKLFETKLSYIQLIDNRIIRVELKPNQVVGSKKMQENLTLYKKLLGKKKGLFFTILDPFVTTEENLHTIYKNKQRIELKEAEAFVVPNLSSRIEVDYLTLEIPKYYPVKLFKDEKKALAWLRAFEK